MQLVSTAAAAAVLWVSAVSAAGIYGNLNSFSSWTVLAGVAIFPSLVLMRRQNDPQPSMSQSIQEALR